MTAIKRISHHRALKSCCQKSADKNIMPIMGGGGEMVAGFESCEHQKLRFIGMATEISQILQNLEK